MLAKVNQLYSVKPFAVQIFYCIK